MSGLRVSISMSMCTGVTARWARVCPVCVSLYEYVYSCHSEMDTCLCLYEHVYWCHSEMDPCMSGLRVSVSMSMCTVVTARWARVYQVCVSLYL